MFFVYIYTCQSNIVMLSGTLPSYIMFRFVFSQCRHNPYFIVGLCFGLSLSCIFSFLSSEDCMQLSPNSVSLGLEDDLQSSLYSEISDEYEPRINLAGKPLRAQKTPQLLIRPRYYSTELGIREKLFVAVLTSQSTIASQGVAFNKTVAHLVDKVMFFIDAPGPQKLNISMPGIVGFTDTRQILKPFHMLKYITDNYLDEFDFFYFIKDTTYVKARLLRELVLGTSVSENVHLGSGKRDLHTAFCSLDAGLLLSNSVMKKVLSNLDWCVKNAFSKSDSDNVGRCILHATELKCQDSVQGLRYSSYRLKENFNIEEENERLSLDPGFHSALSIYPIRDPNNLYKLHSYFCKVALTESKTQESDLRQSINNMSAATPPPTFPAWPIGVHGGSVPGNRFDVLRWDYFTHTDIYLDTDFSNVRELSGANLKDIQYVLNASILQLLSNYSGALEYRRLISGFRRFDPSRGMDYLLDIVFRDKTTGKDVQKRVEVCKPLGKVEVIPMPYVTENSRVHIILPIYASRSTEAKLFIEKYQTLTMEKRDMAFLMLVLLYEPQTAGTETKYDAFREIKALATSLSDKYKKDGSQIAWVSLKLPQALQMLSRPLLEFAIADLTVRKFNPDSLVLLVQPNMELRQDYVNRVRMNTILGWQVFSPIPFTEFDPDIVYNAASLRPKDLDINKTYGHYDSKSYAHIAFYAADYLNARKLITDSVPIVKSDRELSSLMALKSKAGFDRWINGLYAMFVSASQLHVVRTTEPGLRLRHHALNCHQHISSIAIYENCIDKRNFNLGTRSQLAKTILDFKSQR